MSVGIIRWEDPPTAKPIGRHGVTLANELIASQLRRHPGEWALIAENPGNSSLAGHIKSAAIAAFRPAGSYEAVTRTVEGVVRIYARHVGEAGERSDTPNVSDLGGDR